jgi:hypothetical protein
MSTAAKNLSSSPADSLMKPHLETCKSCSSGDIRVFYRSADVPVNSCLLFQDQAEARSYPRGEIELGFCRSCGFIGNLCFDPNLARYTDAYEEQQSFSPRFNAFSNELATRLIERHALRDKTVIEIGCGKGDFLLLLCELGNNRGIGIDPSYVPGRYEGPAAGRVEFISDFYSERYAHYSGEMLCCRHTLEHIADTFGFVQMVRRVVGNNHSTAIFFELPDVERVLREYAFWDIYYEHCSYFTLGSLARLFRKCGFEVLNLEKAYDGQYLLLEARASDVPVIASLSNEESPNPMETLVSDFERNHAQNVRRWREIVLSSTKQGRRVAVWGSGSKCVSFLSTVGVTDEIDLIVDINPYRQGKYLPGSGKQISSPVVLKDSPPDLVIAMNPIYLEEIGRELKSMGVTPELMAV